MKVAEFLYRNKSGSEQILPIESSAQKDRTRALKRAVKKIELPPEAKAARFPKILGDVVESVIGAVYLDLGRDMKRTWGVIQKLTVLFDFFVYGVRRGHTF